MIDYMGLLNLVIRVIVLVFTCLSLAIAFQRARVHLSWLVPTAVGQGLSVIGGLFNLAFMTAMRSGGYSGNPMRWLLVPQQALYILASFCLIWAAVALFLTLQAMTAGAAPSRPEAPVGRARGDNDSWPPPPDKPSI